ncbi:MAG: hypothetical protein VB099_01740 [Candidatus Limiplasma sp.]|nr:hypothetical protein [Candidatus Limiplasma sp.]
MNETLLIILLVGLVASAALVLLLRDLLKACIALSVVSAILAVVMFVMGADLAAVFELSVCAGLITVVFVSTISMSRVLTKEEMEEREKRRWRRFRYLPLVLLAVLAVSLAVLWPYLAVPLPPSSASALKAASGKEMIWNLRQTDLLAQVIIVLVGIYAVLIFFKKKEGEEK